jgi:hypothetical protein
MDWIIVGMCYLAWAFIFSSRVDVHPNNKRYELTIKVIASLLWPLIIFLVLIGKIRITLNVK